MKKNSTLITGSTRGLGKELALIFAERGHNLIVHGRNQNDGEEVINEIRESTKNEVTPCIVYGDIRETFTLHRIQNIAREREITVLINNAGMGIESPLENTSDTEIDEVLSTNLTATIKLTKRIYTLFLEKKEGVIININSMLGREPKSNKSIYCASKSGLKAFTESLRMEAKEHNIRIMGVYTTRIMTKPEHLYGLEPREVAEKIFDAYTKNIEDLIIDNR